MAPVRGQCVLRVILCDVTERCVVCLAARSHAFFIAAASGREQSTNHSPITFVCCMAGRSVARAQGPVQRFSGHGSDWPAGEPVLG